MAEVGQKQPAGRTQANGSTILVVDDDASILESLKLGIQLPGLKVTTITAGDGAEGLEQIAIHHPKLIVLDLQMPQMNGFDFLQRLEELDERPYIIMLTAEDYPQNLLRSIDMKVDTFMSKPFDLSALEAAIAQGLRMVREREQSTNDGRGPVRKHRNERRVREMANYVGVTPHTQISFECECLEPGCRDKILLPISEYEYYKSKARDRHIVSRQHADSINGRTVAKLPQFLIMEPAP